MANVYEYNAETGEGAVRALTAEEKAELAKNKPSAEQLREVARQQRNKLLANTDWTQLPDAPVDSAAFSEYRQALRDLDLTDPEKIKWPTKP